MKKRVLYAVIGIAVVAVAAITLYLALAGQTQGCGPDSLEIPGYGEAGCGRPCVSDGDCVFTCGCGAISKGEECFKGEEIQCFVAWPVKCVQGKCEIDTGGNA